MGPITQQQSPPPANCRPGVRKAPTVPPLILTPFPSHCGAAGYNEVCQLGWGFVCEGLQEPRVVTAFVSHLDDPPVPLEVDKVGCGEYHCAAIASQTGELYAYRPLPHLI